MRLTVWTRARIQRIIFACANFVHSEKQKKQIVSTLEFFFCSSIWNICVKVNWKAGRLHLNCYRYFHRVKFHRLIFRSIDRLQSTRKYLNRNWRNYDISKHTICELILNSRELHFALCKNEISYRHWPDRKTKKEQKSYKINLHLSIPRAIIP